VFLLTAIAVAKRFPSLLTIAKKRTILRIVSEGKKMLLVGIMEGGECTALINVAKGRLHVGSRFPFREGVKMVVTAIEMLREGEPCLTSSLGPDALIEVDYVAEGSVYV
jgi:hypothetical protein